MLRSFNSLKKWPNNVCNFTIVTLAVILRRQCTLKKHQIRLKKSIFQFLRIKWSICYLNIHVTYNKWCLICILKFSLQIVVLNMYAYFKRCFLGIKNFTHLRNFKYFIRIPNYQILLKILLCIDLAIRNKKLA